MIKTRSKTKKTLDDIRLGVNRAAIRRSSALIRNDFLWQGARYIVISIDTNHPNFVHANPIGGGPSIRVSAKQVIESRANEQALRATDYKKHEHQEASEVAALC